jgi:hypothetical protein
MCRNNHGGTPRRAILPVVVANRGLLALLARQDGLITAVQAAECGLAERALQRRVGHEVWRRVAPRVFLVAGHR